MRSGYKITWSAESKRNLAEIILYLETNWTNREIKKFFRKVEKIITLIKTRPQIFRLANKRKRIRKCVVSKQVSLFYRVDSRTVYIVSVFDNRRDPKSLSFNQD